MLIKVCSIKYSKVTMCVLLGRLITISGYITTLRFDYLYVLWRYKRDAGTKCYGKSLHITERGLKTEIEQLDIETEEEKCPNNSNRGSRGAELPGAPQQALTSLGEIWKKHQSRLKALHWDRGGKKDRVKDTSVDSLEKDVPISFITSRCRCCWGTEVC